MSYLRRLIPDLLVHWDLHLLQNWPRLWATRIHYHLWFLLLCNAAAFITGMVVTVNTRRFPDPEELFLYMMVVVVAYFAFWVYRVVRFNVEKRFGIRAPYAEVGEFFVHLASILLILSIPYTFSLTVAWRIDKLVSDEEFAMEVELLNEQAPWFYGLEESYEYYDLPFVDADEVEEMTYDAVYSAIDEDLEELRDAERSRAPQGSGTHEFFRNFEEYRHRFDAEEERTSELLPLHSLYTSYINSGNRAADPTDTANYSPDSTAYYFAKADSIERNFPLLYIQRGTFTPSYFVQPYAADSLREEAYLRRFAAQEPMDRHAIERALAIGVKYSRFVRNIGPDSVAYQFGERLGSTTQLNACGRQMDRISKAKELYYFFAQAEVMTFGMLLPCFILALFLGIFKSSYWQPFLIALVTGGLVPILVLVFALITERVLFSMNDGDIMMYAHWWIGLGLLFVPFTIPLLKAYRTHRAVMLILANAIVPFFAIYTLSILHNEFDIFGEEALDMTIDHIRSINENDARLPALWSQLQELREFIELVMLCTLWGGMALYAFVLHPLFRRLHSRLLALPEVR